MPDISKIKIVKIEDEEEETFDVKDDELRQMLNTLLSKKLNNDQED